MSASKRRPPRETWNRWSDQPRGPKPPPPAHGIKIKNVGATWWGRRWIEALEKISPEYASRLARGKTYARAGRAHDLVVAPGKVTARVTGSRAEPYAITIAIAQLGDASWDEAIAALAARARYAAQLLAGEMPKDVDDVLRTAGVSLFPANTGDLTTSCSCPDWANPCKHVAAAHYVLGEAFDRDPFLLFELRGRMREAVLAKLGGKTEKKADASPAAAIGMSIGRISADDYDAWRGAMPSLKLGFAPVVKRAAVIASLGTPPSWREKRSPADLLGPLVTEASEHARRVAGRTTARPEDI